MNLFSSTHHKSGWRTDWPGARKMSPSPLLGRLLYSPPLQPYRSFRCRPDGFAFHEIGLDQCLAATGFTSCHLSHPAQNMAGQ